MDQEAPYGFAPTEFEERVARAQRLMDQLRVDGLLLTSMDNIRYFIGVDSTFWESYTRPWFVLVPATGAPLAIIPEIGRAIIEKTWIKGNPILAFASARGRSNISRCRGDIEPAPPTRKSRG